MDGWPQGTTGSPPRTTGTQKRCRSFGCFVPVGWYHNVMRSYFVNWSEEDNEWVATCSDEPFCSYLTDHPVTALAGLLEVLGEVSETQHQYDPTLQGILARAAASPAKRHRRRPRTAGGAQ